MKILLVGLLTALSMSVTLPALAEVFVMSSQVGYEFGDPMRAIVRGEKPGDLTQQALFEVVDADDRSILKKTLEPWGEKWGAYWWVADFSTLQKAGKYRLHIWDGEKKVAASDPIELDKQPLWEASYPVIAYDYLKTRSQQARTGKGWKDCGSDLQEFSSHAVCIDGIADVLEHLDSTATTEQRRFLKDQLIRGCDYMAHLQDKAAELGLGDGAVIHEDRDQDVVTGNLAKAAALLARVSHLIADHNSEKSVDFLQRAKRSFAWIEHNGPILPSGSQAFFASVHGAPTGSTPPAAKWMTRDLVTMMRAAVQLYKCGELAYQAKAIDYAQQIIARQIPESNAEGGLYGHFYTYDADTRFNGVRLSEKANIHCGAWSDDGRIYNKGGHYPHYLLPLIEMLELWPSHDDAAEWKAALHRFAYGYLIPACRQSPFLIMPAGYYQDEGLVYFGCWYHAHNNIYAFTASLALELGQLFDDPELRQIAVGNLQWIAGLNCGLSETKPANYLPVSMIYGVGNRSRGSWSKIPGSVCNGFSASPQFKIVPITAATDKPRYFDDEAYIAHSLPYLAAVARLRAYRD